VKSKLILVIPLTLIILGMGIFTFSYASVESEAEEDIQSGCRNGQTLVHRFTYDDYVCVDPSTADRWVELKIAEITQTFTRENINNDDNENNADLDYESKYPGAPPLPPKKSSKDISLSECREGQVLVYRSAYGDTFCVNSATAMFWERLGLAQIVNDDSKETTVDKSITSTDTDMMEETPVEDTQETPVEDTQLNSESKSSDLEDIYDYPKIHQIQRGMWAIVDYDKTTSVFIEGDSGIIVIDSLNSYNSNKKALNEFKTISDKKIKVIVLTSANTQLTSYNAFTENGDNVKIILSDALMEIYRDNDLSIPNTITYDSKFSLDVAGVQLVLSSASGFNSVQTYVSFPSDERILVGDSNNGIFPIVLDIRHFQDIEE